MEIKLIVSKYFSKLRWNKGTTQTRVSSSEGYYTNFAYLEFAWFLISIEY